MKSILERAADLLMYNGPTLREITNKAFESGNDYRIDKVNGFDILQVTTVLPYGIKAIDKYFFNNENQLVKQILLINNKEKLIFDKFAEVQNLLDLKEIEDKKVS
ncbi:hypothetical protein ACFFJQ_07025 [Bacillus capparidis]|uniref:Uncharacterized protein n=1 Tax=Bacillus capparidis TaxID=1840411 RepID=A0ABS4D1L8_9BACI|nr:hypothetical protein [Bacillus capparidis]MBP1083520.1 hypothetical protein [Bacillus capparidis]MED1094718.1 hypothetical protein [Bacillus capparidis]